MNSKIPLLVACATAMAGAFAVVALASSRRVVQMSAAETVATSFQSTALKGRLSFLIDLPAGYASSGKRYPVVYFLHGLPANPTSYRSLEWVKKAIERTSRSAILVIPQATRTAGGDPEYQNWGPGNNWETALGVELPAYIDARYRTIADRGGRAIIGVSAGGYGAAIIGIHHLSEFSAIESWSGYFRPTVPTGKKTLDVGSDVANANATIKTLVPTLAVRLSSSPTLLAFYVGRNDPTFVKSNLDLDAELSSAGIKHVFALYPGGHNASVWEAHARAWLELALDDLSSSTTSA